MRRIGWLLAVAIAGMMLMPPDAAEAVGRGRSVDEIFDDSSVVFAGVLVRQHMLPRRWARIRVTRVWKGPDRSHLVVRPGYPFVFTSADASFQEGAEVLVGANMDVHGLKVNGTIAGGVSEAIALYGPGRLVTPSPFSALGDFAGWQVLATVLASLFIVQRARGLVSRDLPSNRTVRKSLFTGGCVGGTLFGLLRLIPFLIDIAEVTQPGDLSPSHRAFRENLLILVLPPLLAIGIGALLGAVFGALFAGARPELSASARSRYQWIVLGASAGFFATWWWDTNLIFGLELAAGVLCGALGGWIGQRNGLKRIRRERADRSVRPMEHVAVDGQ